MDFGTIGSLICGQEKPFFLGIFDFSTAPQLLFYSYIPIIIASAIIGFYIYIKDRKSLQSKLLLFVVLFFILWVLNILVQWVASYHTLLMFAWQLTAIFEVGLFLISVYFAYVFINKNDLPFSGKLILWVLELITICLTSTKLNISSYDLQNCEGVLGPLWNIIYSLEPIIIVSIIYIGFVGLRKKSDVLLRKQIIIFTTGLTFFLTTFFISNFYGQLTRVYAFNLWGPVGMLIFFILLSYLIVRYKAFNIKLIATQALVWSLAILIGSQFFFIKVPINFVLTAITLIATIIFGYLLIQSVKKEIQQREELEKLNIKLNQLLQQRESLMHLVTHKVKGSFTHSKYIFAEILAGSFGQITDDIKKIAEKGLESVNAGIETVDIVLNAANLSTGKVKYDMLPLDFKDIVQKTISEKKGPAEARGLKLETDIKDGNYNLLGDSLWLKEVANNLVENSIRYTRVGTITVGLERKNDKILFSVKDTGVGVTEEDKKNLFTEGGRGKESVKVNIESTGYGLFTVKMVVEAHQGKVWVESEGAGKGSTFFAELPAA